MAVDDSGAGFITDEDTPFDTADVLDNDSDPDGDALFVSSYDVSNTQGEVTFIGGSPGGDLDPSFGGDGLVTTDIGMEDWGSGIAIQPDGKIIVAGDTGDLNEVSDFAVARYNPDGSLDLSFDTDGIVTIDFYGYRDFAERAILQPDGKILVVGATWVDEITLDHLALARLNPDGSLDSSFDEDGKVYCYDFIWGFDLALQPDGKIIAAGFTNLGGPTNADFALARYNPDGSLDATFDGDGMLTTDFDNGFDGATAIALQPDEKIVVAGLHVPDAALARYNPDGSLDASFDGDGKLTFDFGGYDYPWAIERQSDGKLVVAGYAELNDEGDFAAARFNPDGSLDLSFGDDGIVVTDFNNSYEYGMDMTIQLDGKIIIVGGSSGAGFALARYNPDGSLDASFGEDGLVTTALGLGWCVVIQADGKIVVAGTNGDFALARYNPGEGGFFHYDPNGQFEWLAVGESVNDTFRYVVSDGVLTDTAIVTVTVTGLNDAPLAADDAYSTTEDTPLAVPAPGVLANDDDPENDPLSASLLTPPTHGSLSLSPDGSFLYTPDFNYNGPDAFSYIASDGILTDTATVTITVSGLNDAPITSGDLYTSTEDTLLSVPSPGVLGNDSDPDGNALTDSPMTLPTHGSLTLNPDGSFLYSPEADYDGTDAFTYIASDGVLTDTAVVTITVAGVNDTPIVAAGADQAIDEGDPASFSGAFTDPDMQPGAAVAWDYGDGNTITGTLTPIHTYLDDGIYTVTLAVTDTDGASGDDWLVVTAVNVAPVIAALPDLSLEVGEAFTLTVAFSDPGVLDTHTVVITWGDGISETVALAAGVLELSISHAYSGEGIYTASVTVSDLDGGIDAETFIALVSNPTRWIYLPVVTR
jgi:uncharacterized delta-60 repeat protein